LIKYQRL